jgi:branched-chain amino acid transport system permease protein
MRPLRGMALALIVAALAVAAMELLGTYERFLVGRVSTVVLVTLGLTILIGAAGQLSLASAAFMAIGAYGVVILMGRLQVPAPVAIVLALALASGTGWVVGLVSLRLEGFYLAIVTFGFVQVVQVMLTNGGKITGAYTGLLTPELNLFGQVVSYDIAARASLFVAVLAAFGTFSLLRSPFGRAFRVIKFDSTVAALQGINVVRVKTVAFASSAAMAAAGGILQAFLQGTISPDSYTITTSIDQLVAVVVGGMTGTVAGVIAAPALLILLPEYIPSIQGWADVLNGVLVILVLALLPGGLGSLLERMSKGLSVVGRHLGVGRLRGLLERR